MLILSMGGYLAGSLAIGAPDAGWVAPLSFVPFLSPWLMPSRVLMGTAEPWEVGLAVLFLLISIAVAMVLAARVYRAGVLLYGQRPGARQIVRVAIGGR
jgi:ABC-2 type transport system permease protein